MVNKKTLASLTRIGLVLFLIALGAVNYLYSTINDKMPNEENIDSITALCSKSEKQQYYHPKSEGGSGTLCCGHQANTVNHEQELAVSPSPTSSKMSDSHHSSMSAHPYQDLNQWLDSWDGRKERIKEGVRIAKAQNAFMKELIEANPDKAYSHALSEEKWQSLPEATKPHVARKFHSKGKYYLTHSCESKEIFRSMEAEGFSSYNISVSPSLKQIDKYEGELKGVALGKSYGLVSMAAATNEPHQEFAAAAHAPPGPNGAYAVLWLNVRCSDETDYPATISAVTAEMNIVVDKFSQWSYGRVSMSYDVANVDIASSSGAAPGTVSSEADQAAAAAGYNLSQYDTIIYRNSWYGNVAQLGGNSIWLKRNANSTAVHEIGHNMGLWHANLWKVNNDQPAWGDGYSVSYAEDWDAMANSPRGDFNAYEKKQLGWLDAGTDYIDDVPSGTYRIYPYDSHQGISNTAGVDGAYYSVSVFKDTQTANGAEGDRRYRLSFRNQPEHGSGYNAYFTNGILLHWDPWKKYTGSGSWDFGPTLIDVQVRSSSQISWKEQYDAPIKIGQTYVDNDPGNRDGNIYITVLSKTDPDGIERNGDEYMDVKIAIGDQSGNQPPVASLSVDKTNVAIGQTVNFSVDASDPDDNALAYDWDFDVMIDNNTRKAQPLTGLPTQSYSWNNEGIYTVSVVVSDGRGGTVTLSQEINVRLPALVISESDNDTIVTEGGAPDTFTVKLTLIPTDSVTVSLSTNSEITVSPTSLTFTPSDYDLEQTVTVTAVDDSLHDLRQVGLITMTATSADPNWNGINDTLQVTVFDDDNTAPVADAGPDQWIYMPNGEQQGWTPAMISTTLWLDASDLNTITLNGSTVSQWADKSGNANHATQETAGSQPTYDSVNNRLTFDGNDIMKVANDPFKGLQNFAVVTVQKWNTDSGWNNASVAYHGESGNGWQVRQRNDGSFCFTVRGTGGSDDPTSTSTNNLDFLGSCIRKNSSDRVIRQNGTETFSTAGDTGTIAYTGTNRSSIGGRYQGDSWSSPAGYLKGELKEVIVIENPMDGDVQTAEGYLAWKWGLEASLPIDHPFKGGAPGAVVAVTSLPGSGSDFDNDPITFTWTKISGPGTVTFENATSGTTPASFSEVGVYVLRLTASDGNNQHSDDVVITVLDPNVNTLGFTSSDYSQAEGDNGTSTITVSVARTGDGIGVIEVGYTATDGTATTADSDYEPASGTLTWADGDLADKSFTVTINGDTTPESDETVTVSLSLVSGDVAINPATATVTLLDDDTTYTLTYTSGTGGSISGTSPQTVAEGADGAEVTAVANAGYHFVDWSDGSTQNPRTDTNVTADITVSANFAEASSGVVSVNFRRSNGQTEMPTSDSAGAVVAVANWNNTAGSNAGTTANISGPTSGKLVDDSGAETAVDIGWSFGTTWGATNSGNADSRMMSGYVDNNSGVGTITVSNITASSFSVYAYFGSDGNGRTGTIGIDGAETYSFKTASAGKTYPEGYVQTTDTGTGYPSANYAVWTGLTGSGFTLTHTRISGNSGVHGIQIILGGSTPPTIADVDLPAGISLYGYTGENSIDAQTAFQGLIDNSKLSLVRWVDPSNGQIKELYYTTFPSAGWVNEIGDLTLGQGYVVKTTAAATLSIAGNKSTASVSLDLPAGYSIVGFNKETPMDAQAVFQPLIDAGELDLVRWVDPSNGQIKELYYTTFPSAGWVNEIGDLTEGQGYIIKLNAPHTGFALP